MQKYSKLFVVISSEIALLVTPMLYPTLPQWAGVLAYVVALLFLVAAVWPYLTKRRWLRDIWLRARYPRLQVYFSEKWLGLTSERTMAKTVGDRVIWTEPDIRVTGVDFKAKNHSDHRITDFRGFLEPIGSGIKIPLTFDGMAPEETYGIPGKAEFHINARFPSSAPPAEGYTIEHFWRDVGAFRLVVQFDGDTYCASISEKELDDHLRDFLASSARHHFTRTQPRIERKS